MTRATAKAVVLGIVLSLAGNTARPAQRFQVSATRLGGDVEDMDALVERVVTKLHARPEFEAALAANPRPAAQSWFTPPDGVAPDQWLSVVAVGFGARRDWLAFAFADEPGVASMALRRPASLRAPESGYLHESAPGPLQVSHNAVAELAAAVAQDSARGDRGTAPSDVISITVSALEAESDQPLGPVTEEEQHGIRALAFAAAAVDGWRPATDRRPQHLQLAVQRGPRSFTIDATLTRGGEKANVVRRMIDEEYVYDGLVNLVRSLRFWGGGVSDDMQIEPGEFTLVACDKDRLLVAGEGTLRALRLSTGLPLWDIPKPERSTPHYEQRVDAAGRVRVYQYDGRLSEVNPASGVLVEFNPRTAAATHPWGFDIGPGPGTAEPAQPTGAAVEERHLAYVDRGEEAWRLEAGDLLGCGPMLLPDHVLVGGDTGELFCLARSDGSTTWRTQVAERLRGRITVVDGLVIAGSVEGTVYARSRETGDALWEHPLGDILLAEPLPAGDAILVAGRNSVVRLLARDTGETRASHTAKGWLTGVALVGDGELVAYADRNGNVVFLNAGNLAPVREIPLHATLQRGLLASPSVAHRWRTAEDFDHDLVDEGPAVLVCDRRGFVYVIPVPER